MRTQLFIENYEADVSEDISTLLTFELDDVKDFSSRSTTWSKTVVLPGTARNNDLFGNIFQVGQSNEHNPGLDNIGYNYNASKAADCIIFQDQLQTFKGVLRLMQINSFKGKIEYEVAMFGEIHGLNVALSGSLLEDLDFSAYDHAWNETNIVNSWDNVSGVSYYYPLIDHGNYSLLKADWDFRTFRPALYAKEYIDKMFTEAGFRYECDLFDTARFKSLIIPYNRKQLLSSNSNIYNASGTTSQPSLGFLLLEFEDQAGSGFTTSDEHIFTFAAVSPGTITIDWSILASTGNGTGYQLLFKVNNITHTTQTIFGAFEGDPAVNSVSVTLSPGDNIRWILDSILPTTLTATEVSFSATAAAGLLVELGYGETVQMNDCIPKNIRQVDFFLSIIKLFNLYVYEHRQDPRLILITPYVDFYSTDSADSVDWTYKLNRDKTVKVRPMSELNSKKYEFKYKPDTDYYNDLYRKRYGQGYGDYIFDSAFEFAEQTNSLELIFSATVLVGWGGEDKIFSTIFKLSNQQEESIDYNIRILQAKKIEGVTSWDLLDDVTVLTSLTKYGYAGHLNDPDAPSNDLNFGVLAELFFTLVSGDLTVTQFNVYWSAYMAEITDKDSKLLEAFFYLTNLDIMNLDFSKKIFIDSVLFRLNKIKDFNVSNPTDSEIELLKVNFLVY